MQSVRIVLAVLLITPLSFAETISVGKGEFVSDVVAQNPGHRIHLPVGSYELTEALVINASHTELVGPGTLVQTNPDAAIIEVRADHVRLRDLTLTRSAKATKDRDGIEAKEAKFLRLESIRIHDNHSAGASIQLHDCQFSKVQNCVIENYKCVAIDDRTMEPLYGYAFRCLNGTGIAVRGGRGNQLLDNHIIESRLLPTREIKEQHHLGDLAEGREPTKFGQLGRHMERSGFARNWHQGSAILVTAPEDTELTRISGNYLENCAQGIDLHCDRAIVTHNTINGGMIGIKAMHGSRHLIISENMLNRIDLWGILLGPGASSHANEPPNNDGAVRMVGNIISNYGEGHEFWNWGGNPDVSGSYAIRIDRGQIESNPPIRDVLVQGNIITNNHLDRSKYRYAFHMEMSDSDSVRNPRNIQVYENLFDAGTGGVSNVPLPLGKAGNHSTP